MERKITMLKPIKKSEKVFTTPVVIIGSLLLAVLFVNQFQIMGLTGKAGMVLRGSSSSVNLFAGGGDLSNVDVESLQSTAQTIAAVFDLEGKNGDEVMAMMFPTGTPEYGEQLGVSFDDPVNSLDTLAKMHRPLSAEVQQADPEAFARFAHLASTPKGISCEYCCGVGPIGADANGNSRCGCAHNPGVLSVALYLSAYSDYNDAEILREVMKWKTLWFPKNMIELGSQIAGGDSAVLHELPGMVGGC
jgi:hypothetical protein